MSSKEGFVESDLYGRYGENLVREILKTNKIWLPNHYSFEWPMVVSADEFIHNTVEKLRLTQPLYEGMGFSDRKIPLVKSLLDEMRLHKINPNNDWFTMMYKHGESNQSPNHDFTSDGYLVESKRDGMFSGSRTGEEKKGGDPTYNICFEIADSRGRPSGVYRPHDYMGFVLDNRHGQPMLVIMDDSRRLRTFVEAWKKVKSSVFGGNDYNAEMVNLWLPYYITNTLPFTEG